MTCIKCDHDMADCTCDDRAERIDSVLKSEFIYFGSEYRKRLEQAAVKAREEQSKTE